MLPLNNEFSAIAYLNSLTECQKWVYKAHKGCAKCKTSLDHIVEYTLQARGIIFTKEIKKESPYERFRFRVSQIQINLLHKNEGADPALKPTLNQLEALSTGYTVNYPVNEEKDTLLHLAVRAKKLPLISSLIRKGGVMHMRNNKRETPLEMAAQLDILSKIHHFRDEVGVSMIQRMIDLTNVNFVKLLLEAGVEIPESEISMIVNVARRGVLEEVLLMSNANDIKLLHHLFNIENPSVRQECLSTLMFSKNLTLFMLLDCLGNKGAGLDKLCQVSEGNVLEAIYEGNLSKDQFRIILNCENMPQTIRDYASSMLD